MTHSIAVHHQIEEFQIIFFNSNKFCLYNREWEDVKAASTLKCVASVHCQTFTNNKLYVVKNVRTDVLIWITTNNFMRRKLKFL